MLSGSAHIEIEIKLQGNCAACSLLVYGGKRKPTKRSGAAPS